MYRDVGGEGIRMWGKWYRSIRENVTRMSVGVYGWRRKGSRYVGRMRIGMRVKSIRYILMCEGYFRMCVYTQDHHEVNPYTSFGIERIINNYMGFSECTYGLIQTFCTKNCCMYISLNNNTYQTWILKFEHYSNTILFQQVIKVYIATYEPFLRWLNFNILPQMFEFSFSLFSLFPLFFLLHLVVRFIRFVEFVVRFRRVIFCRKQNILSFGYLYLF